MSDAPGDRPDDSPADADAAVDRDLEELRRRVEEKYDFEEFGPAQMAEMTGEEWEAAFDPDVWITGDELLKRVERELKARIADRDVFATLEYAAVDGERRLVAYSDADYAVVYPDGSVEGRGTVVRDVESTVALCSMTDYEVDDPPERWALPGPGEVSTSGSELGNWMLQLLAAAQILLGLVALAAWLTGGVRSQLVLGVTGLALVVVGVFLFALVANARLAGRFRAEQYRRRLRSIGRGADERPSFLPFDDEAFERADREATGDDRRRFES
ncbi:DUF7319 domain-containing protein [Salinilacihabitans rarus]|uniref:DUF7319 domain-containing protein n=1 Tax=Salinilacihabitans rarus TaxID=2961596 RepID=UPI0020C8FD5E|nr:hypothetical protein [Salinilacihabitans rarus]